MNEKLLEIEQKLREVELILNKICFTLNKAGIGNFPELM